jgi:hypothetical protein
MIGLAKAIRRIIAVNAPLLCIDTCSILDLIRDPTRGKFTRQHAESALHLIARAEEKPPSVTIILAEQVLRELDDNLAEVRDEAKRVIEKLNNELNIALEICHAYGVLRGDATAAVVPNGFSTAAENIIQRIRRSAIHLRGSAASTKLAHLRVIDPRAPAATGKQSTKDCLIIENYLQVVGRARGEGFTQAAVFLTNNTADYRRGSTLHPDLSGDFQHVALTFATNYPQARFLI